MEQTPTPAKEASFGIKTTEERPTQYYSGFLGTFWVCRFCDITYSQGDCVEAGCNYDACDGYVFRRRLHSFFDTDYGGSNTYSAGWVCLEGCDPAPAGKKCEQYADFDCPLLAGCGLAQPQAIPATTPPTTPSTSSTPTADTQPAPASAGGNDSGGEAPPATRADAISPTAAPTGNSSGPSACSAQAWLLLECSTYSSVQSSILL